MSDEVVDDQEEQGSSAEEAPDETAGAGAVKRQVTLAVPPIDRLLVLLGASAMVLSGLLSWIEVAPDAFPNFAGIGAGGGGVGLVVTLIGIALLSRRPQIDTAKGVALGAFLASLVTVIVLVDESDGVGMGAGAWVAMVGSFVALTGIAFAMMDRRRRPNRQVRNNAVAMVGAGLAIIASFWMDWAVSTEGVFFGDGFVVSGLDGDVATGYPILILGVLVLLLLLGLLSPTTSERMRADMAIHIRVAAIAVAALAAGDLAGSLMTSTLTGSGPVLALVGAMMIARSVGPADAAEAETAEAEAA